MFIKPTSTISEIGSEIVKKISFATKRRM